MNPLPAYPAVQRQHNGSHKGPALRPWLVRRHLDARHGVGPGREPQSEHAIGGYRVQGRGDAAEEVVADAIAVADAGAFAVVLEMVPGDVAKRITHELAIPTIGIAAGPHCDGCRQQVLDSCGTCGQCHQTRRIDPRNTDGRAAT